MKAGLKQDSLGEGRAAKRVWKRPGEVMRVWTSRDGRTGGDGRTGLRALWRSVWQDLVRR